MVVLVSLLLPASAEQFVDTGGAGCAFPAVLLTVPSRDEDGVPTNLRPHVRMNVHCSDAATHITIRGPEGVVHTEAFDLDAGFALDLQSPTLDPVQNYTLEVVVGEQPLATVPFRTGIGPDTTPDPEAPTLELANVHGGAGYLDVEGVLTTTRAGGYVTLEHAVSREPTHYEASPEGVRFYTFYTGAPDGEQCFVTRHRDAIGRVSDPSAPFCQVADTGFDELYMHPHTCQTGPDAGFAALLALVPFLRRRR